MARVFIDGFESQRWLKSTGGLWDTSTGTGLNVYTPGYGGVGYCFGSPNNAGTLRKDLPAAVSYYFGLAFKGNSGNTGRIFRIYAGSNILALIYYSAITGLYNLYRGDQTSLLAVSSFGVPGDTWAHLQVYYAPSTTSGIFILKINGVEAANFTGNTSPWNYNVDAIELVTSGGGCQWYWDNVVVDNSSWTGVSRIAILTPSGAGNSAQWDPSTGSNYACVDEVPYSDTDYVSTNVVDEVDTYAMSDLPSEAAVVKCVQVTARARKDGASTPQNIALAVRTTGGDYYSTDQVLQTSFVPHNKIWENNPNSGVAWTISEVNAMEAGVKSRT